MTEGVLVVHNINGDVLLEIKEEDVDWPADDESHVMSAIDVMVLVGIEEQEHAVYDLNPIMPAGWTSESILMDDDKVQWGESYMLQHRPCPRCTLCNRLCERVGVHKLCSHKCSGTNMSEALHLWHIYYDQSPEPFISTQGYLNGVGLQIVFPEDVIEDELRHMCGEFDISDEHLQRVRSLARA